MTSISDAEPAPRESPGLRLSTFFFRHPRFRLGALLAGPLGWMVLLYLGSLFVLLLAAFWDTGGAFGTEVIRDWNLDNFRRLFDRQVCTATSRGGRSEWRST